MARSLSLTGTSRQVGQRSAAEKQSSTSQLVCWYTPKQRPTHNTSLPVDVVQGFGKEIFTDAGKRMVLWPQGLKQDEV